MASSRKSKLSLKAIPKSAKRIGLAVSGGLDSVVLLDTVCKTVQVSSGTPTEVWVFHIHHGLQKPADQWLEFCEKLAKKYRVYFDFRLLHFADQSLSNIEAKARAERYDALTELCIEHGIEDLLLAHHQNDQAETVLLQLLRGSGDGVETSPHIPGGNCAPRGPICGYLTCFMPANRLSAEVIEGNSFNQPSVIQRENIWSNHIKNQEHFGCPPPNTPDLA